MLVICGLSIFYLFLNWKMNRDLNKLKEGYNKNEDKSKPTGIQSNYIREDTSGCRKAIDSGITGKRNIKADVDTSTVSTNEPDSIINKRESKKKGIKEE